MSDRGVVSQAPTVPGCSLAPTRPGEKERVGAAKKEQFQTKLPEAEGGKIPTLCTE